MPCSCHHFSQRTFVITIRTLSCTQAVNLVLLVRSLLIVTLRSISTPSARPRPFIRTLAPERTGPLSFCTNHGPQGLVYCLVSFVYISRFVSIVSV
jgi:hypothetical protein